MFVNKPQAGFTLIEIMVAVSIFAIVAVIAVGALLTANTINQKAQATKLVMDNLNFAMDSMVFKMRKSAAYFCTDNFTGFDPDHSYYSDGQACPDGGKAIILTDLSDTERLYAYFLQSRDSGEGVIKFLDSKFGDSVSGAVTLVAPAIDIKNLRFYVTGKSYRRAMLTVFGQAKIGKGITEFALETVAAERF